MAELEVSRVGVHSKGLRTDTKTVVKIYFNLFHFRYDTISFDPLFAGPINLRVPDTDFTLYYYREYPFLTLNFKKDR